MDIKSKIYLSWDDIEKYLDVDAAFGVKGLGYKETELEEVSGKYASSGYSDKLKKVVKESLVREEEKDYTSLPFVSAEKLKKVIQQSPKKIQLKGSDPQSTTEIGSEGDLMSFLMGLRFKQVNPGIYHLQGPNDSTVTMGKGSLDEDSDFEEKMAQLRMLQMQKKSGTAPDPREAARNQRLMQKLNMVKRAYFDLVSAMEKESDLEFAVSGDWYQEQIDDLENTIGDLENKLKSLNENMEMVDTTEEKVESKPVKKAVKKESLDSELAEIDTQAGIVTMEAKLDKLKNGK